MKAMILAGIETRKGLSVAAESFIHTVCDQCKTLDEVWNVLCRGMDDLFPGKFWLYGGSSHIAVHRNLKRTNKGERLVVIIEVQHD